MIFAGDSFTLSKENKTCQDYSISDNHEAPFVILSDGCSSALRSEIGAKMICLSAANVCYEYNNAWDQTQYFALFFHQLKTLFKLLKPFCHTENFDATLLISMIDTETSMVRTFMYGDGFIRINYVNGTKETFQIEYSNNAPFYPIYTLTDELIQEFLGMKQDKIITCLETGEKTITSFVDDLFCTSFEHELKDIESIFIFTDGVDSFRNSDTREKIQPIEIINKITKLNNIKGQFLTRRFISPMGLINEFKETHTEWFDDVSVAGFIRR